MKLAIIGASYLQLPLLRRAKEMRIETHCFAWEKGAVCKAESDFFYPISILEKEQILVKCQQIGINGIISIASDAAVPTVCYVAEMMGLIANPYTDCLVTTNKFEMRKRFEQNNVSSPKFRLSTEFVQSDFQFPVIVKPTDRSGSRGVSLVDSGDVLQSTIERASNESFLQQVIVEENIQGDEVSVESISWQGKHYIITITDKVTTGEPYFVELEHHQPSLLSMEIQDRLKNETIKALNALNIQYGASHAEFKIDSCGNVFVIEVGARMGGDFIGSDLVGLSTGYDYVEGVINVALGKFVIPELCFSKYSGVFFICKETEELLKYIDNADNYREIIKAELMDNELKTVQSSADRSGYIIYQNTERWNVCKKY